MWDRCARVAGGRIVHFYRDTRLSFCIIGRGVVAIRMRGLSRGDVHGDVPGVAGWPRKPEHRMTVRSDTTVIVSDRGGLKTRGPGRRGCDTPNKHEPYLTRFVGVNRGECLYDSRHV